MSTRQEKVVNAMDAVFELKAWHSMLLRCGMTVSRLVHSGSYFHRRDRGVATSRSRSKKSAISVTALYRDACLHFPA